MTTTTARRARRLGTRCWDCLAETLPTERESAAHYMVHDRVWQAARGPARGYLCVGCIETRLGRTLHRGDFTGALINDPLCIDPQAAWSYRSERLLDRLTALSPQDGIQLQLWEMAEPSPGMDALTV